MRPIVLLSAAFAASLVLAGCAKAAPSPSAEAPAATGAPGGGIHQATVTPIAPLAQKKFGAPITEKDSTPLDTLLGDPSKFTTRTVRTEGVVSAVCKNMGCWMEIADDAGQAHIKMAGHSFFVPKNADGHRAVVQGKLVGAEPAAGPGGEDCKAEAQAQTGHVAKVEIEATGVEFLD